MESSIVTPAQIESALTAIWEQMEGAGKMRASLFNLIIYCHQNQRVEYIRKIVQRLIDKFPSRILLVILETEGKNDSFLSKVSIVSPEHAASDVACDLIEIEVSGGSVNRVPFVLLPHILPDLPVYLLWAEDPSQEGLLSSSLEKFASRLIFDSETTDNLPRFARAVLYHLAQSECDVADLNWARMETWRDLFFSTFSSANQLATLQHTKTLHITYNASESPFFCHTRIQSIYLQTWLAGQLGWQLEKIDVKGKEIHFLYTNDLKVVLEPAYHSHLAPGNILSCSIETREKEQFSFSRNVAYPQEITFHYSTPMSCTLPTRYQLPKSESGHALVKEICRQGTSSHYLKVLDLVSRMDALHIC